MADSLVDLDDWSKIDEQVMNCRKCPRLVAWREQVARDKRRAYRDWTYWGRGVPGFGDRMAHILVIGLAPGAHGSNRTGRMFTGDASGDFLYAALHKAGFANQPGTAHRGDGLTLDDLYISAVCRCAPPDNKPASDEIENCQPFLLAEMRFLSQLRGIVVLGKLAFDRTMVILQNYSSIWGPQTGFQRGDPIPVFGHGRFYRFGHQMPWLLASYHPSRQNTQTGRLTESMFDSIWQHCLELRAEDG